MNERNCHDNRVGNKLSAAHVYTGAIDPKLIWDCAKSRRLRLHLLPFGKHGKTSKCSNEQVPTVTSQPLPVHAQPTTRSLVIITDNSSADVASYISHYINSISVSCARHQHSPRLIASTQCYCQHMSRGQLFRGSGPTCSTSWKKKKLKKGKTLSVQAAQIVHEVQRADTFIATANATYAYIQSNLPLTVT